MYYFLPIPGLHISSPFFLIFFYNNKMYFRFLSYNNSLSEKIVALIYGLICHMIFLVAGSCMFLVLYNGFSVSLGTVKYPYNILSNLILLIQFPILHSFLLSTPGRKILRLFAPNKFSKTLETTIYASIASFQLIILFLFWTPTEITIYSINYPYSLINTILYCFSWILLSISSFQAGYKVQTGSLGWTSMFLSKKPEFPNLPVKGLFKLTRQPIYLSFCLILWTPPLMTLDLFIVAIFYSIYCYTAPRFKEKRFKKIYGNSFLKYKENTPYFFPRIF